jgi:hypothetical protein
MGIPRLSGIGPAPAVTEATKRAERKPARDTRELGLFRYAPIAPDGTHADTGRAEARGMEAGRDGTGRDAGRDGDGMGMGWDGAGRDGLRRFGA